MDFVSSILRVGPNDLFVGGDFEDLDAFFRTVTSDHGISVGETLSATRVSEGLLGEICIGDMPYHLSIRIEFNHLIAMGQRNQDVVIGKQDRGERPCFGFAASELF